MSNTQNCQLTTKDYTILEVMLERHLGGDDTMSEILRRKVSGALVMFRDDIPPTVVTLSSRVVYRVNDGRPETRIVAHGEMRGLIGMLLPITHPRGLALLGLAKGQSITIPNKSGGFDTMTVEEVLYQPEAARRERIKLSGEAAPSWGGPVLRVVHRSDGSNELAAKARSGVEIGFDDPGPSAA